MSRRLEGRIAWITGGGTGIGRASAFALAEEGAHVMVSGRRQAELDQTVAALAAAGHEASAIVLDVANADACADAARRIEREAGPVEVLVCSAGTNVPRRFWRDLDLADYKRVMQINVDGVVHCVHPLLPGMRARKSGTIVVISSWAGREFLQFTGVPYGASKTALAPIVESINSEEGRHGIRASLVMPGEVATPILRSRPVPPPEAELERMLQPEDLGDIVRYLACAPARVCVGEVLVGPTHNRIYIGSDDLKGPG